MSDREAVRLERKQRRQAARAALPAVTPPPLPSLVPATEPPPISLGPALAPPLEADNLDSSWLRRQTSFAISLVVHLLLLIGLAVWSVNELNDRQQVVLTASPALPEPETAFEILTPAELAPDLDAIFANVGGDQTDLPDALDMIDVLDANPAVDAPGTFDLTREILAGSELMRPIGNQGGGRQGGGTGGSGPGLEVGEMLDFVHRLERAGAKTGDVQISLIWDNFNDLDLHVFTPRGEVIFFGHRKSRCRGELDVDMNAGQGTTREPVENIFWGKGKAPLGKFKVAVHHFRNHGDPDPTPYELRMIVDGQTKIIKGEISVGNPRLVVYEFERKAGRPGPASVAAPSPNDSPLLDSRR